MASTIPTRVDRELLDSARVVGDTMSRSAPQQLAHRARVVLHATDGTIVETGGKPVTSK